MRPENKSYYYFSDNARNVASKGPFCEIGANRLYLCGQDFTAAFAFFHTDQASRQIRLAANGFLNGITELSRMGSG